MWKWFQCKWSAINRITSIEPVYPWRRSTLNAIFIQNNYHNIHYKLKAFTFQSHRLLDFNRANLMSFFFVQKLNVSFASEVFFKAALWQKSRVYSATTVVLNISFYELIRFARLQQFRIFLLLFCFVFDVCGSVVLLMAPKPSIHTSSFVSRLTHAMPSIFFRFLLLLPCMCLVSFFYFCWLFRFRWAIFFLFFIFSIFLPSSFTRIICSLCKPHRHCVSN